MSNIGRGEMKALARELAPVVAIAGTMAAGLAIMSQMGLGVRKQRQIIRAEPVREYQARSTGLLLVKGSWVFRSSVSESWRVVTPTRLVNGEYEDWVVGDPIPEAAGPESVLTAGVEYERVFPGDLPPGLFGVGLSEGGVFSGYGGGARFYDLLITAGHVTEDPGYKLYDHKSRITLECNGRTTTVNLLECERFVLFNGQWKSAYAATGYDIVAYRLHKDHWSALGVAQLTIKSICTNPDGLIYAFGNPDGYPVRSVGSMREHVDLETYKGVGSFSGNTERTFSGWFTCLKVAGAWKVLGPHSCGDAYGKNANHFVTPYSVLWLLEKAGHSTKSGFFEMLTMRSCESKESKRKLREWEAYAKRYDEQVAEWAAEQEAEDRVYGDYFHDAPARELGKAEKKDLTRKAKHHETQNFYKRNRKGESVPADFALPQRPGVAHFIDGSGVFDERLVAYLHYCREIAEHKSESLAESVKSMKRYNYLLSLADPESENYDPNIAACVSYYEPASILKFFPMLVWHEETATFTKNPLARFDLDSGDWVIDPVTFARVEEKSRAAVTEQAFWMPPANMPVANAPPPSSYQGTTGPESIPVDTAPPVPRALIADLLADVGEVQTNFNKRQLPERSEAYSIPTADHKHLQSVPRIKLCRFIQAKENPRKKGWQDRVAGPEDCTQRYNTTEELAAPTFALPREVDTAISAAFQALATVNDFKAFKQFSFSQVIRSSFLRDYVRESISRNIKECVITKAGDTVVMRDKDGRPAFARRASVPRGHSRPAAAQRVLDEEYMAVLKKHGRDLSSAEFGSKFVMPPSGPEGSEASLRAQAKEVSQTNMSKVACSEELAEELYSEVPRYKLLAETSLDQALRRIYDSMDGTKSSGFDSLLKPGAKAAWLNTEEGRKSLSYRVVCRMALIVSLGSNNIATMSPMECVYSLIADPCQLGTKDEAHSESKAKRKAWRQIWIPSLTAAVCLMLMTYDSCKADISAYDDGTLHSVGIGCGHHDAGIVRLGRLIEHISGPNREPVEGQDASGWDLSVCRDILVMEADSRVYALDTSDIGFMAELIYSLTFINTAHVVQIGGFLWESIRFGITASGVFTTSKQNSWARYFGLRLAGATRAGCIGDDALGSGKVCHTTLLSMGVRVKVETGEHSRINPSGGPHELTSHHFKQVEDPSGAIHWHAEFMNLDKMLAHLRFRSLDGLPNKEAIGGMLFALRHSVSSLAVFKAVCADMGWNTNVPLVETADVFF